MIDVSSSAHYVGDCRELLRELPDACVQTCVTSPPYWGLRDYGQAGQIGLESTPEAYIAELVGVFHEVRRVLRDDGTLWLNLGDSYAMSTKGSSGKGAKQVTNAGTLLADRRWHVPDGIKPKDLVGIPWAVAFALRADGWYLRQDLIWHKPNPMPESVTDRCTKAHEYVFLLTKSARYYFDAAAIAEPAGEYRPPRGKGKKTTSVQIWRDVAGSSSTLGGNGTAAGTRNRRSVWTIASQPYAGAHFATFPAKLIEPCLIAGSRPGDLVLDPFFGSGTTAIVAERHGRRWIGFDLGYGDLASERIAKERARMEAFR